MSDPVASAPSPVAAATPAAPVAQPPGAVPAATGDTSRDAATPAVEKAAADAPKMFKVKVDGKEMEKTEKELIEAFQLRQASDKRMNEAARIQKEYQALIERIQTDPFKVLQDPKLKLSKPMREMAEEYLLAQIEEDALDPRDRELRDTKAKLAQREEAEKRAKEEQESKEMSALREKYQEQFATEITTALEGSGLPRTETTVKRTAFYLSQAVKQGLDLKASDVVELVREDFVNEQKDLLSNLEAEKLLEMFPGLGEKIRKHTVQKHQSKNAGRVQPAAKSVAKRDEPKDTRLSKDEWRARLDRIKRGEE